MYTAVSIYKISWALHVLINKASPFSPEMGDFSSDPE